MSQDLTSLPVEKMPGHWVLASMGKQVLRPGGLETTRWLLDALSISNNDDVVEFAPGLGATARLTLARNPQSYTAVERDADAAKIVGEHLTASGQRCVVGSAEATGLPDACASVVYGEAMLSMQVATAKSRIVDEAARLLRPGGRYGIHELCLLPDDVCESIREGVRRDLSGDIRVGVRPLTAAEWHEILAAAGLKVIDQHTAKMHLLEPARLIRDEGLWRAIRFAWNVATHPGARRRVISMRNVFRKYRENLAAIAIVSQKT